jgi:hypothetical protein
VQANQLNLNKEEHNKTELKVRRIEQFFCEQEHDRMKKGTFPLKGFKLTFILLKDRF